MRLEIPTSKSQNPTKSQNPNPNRSPRNRRGWRLGFGILLGFGCWDLGFPSAAAQAVDWHTLPPGPPTAPRLDGPTFWRENLAKHAKDRASWETRAAWIRRQILVGAGLWPMPERTPLNAEVYGRIARDGYAIEKVRFQSIPGFYVSGNLYRPLGKKGPFPAVLNPHGHWANGRLEMTDNANFQGMGITLAKLGFVVFAYDMVGYADCQQVPHSFAGDLPWGVSLAGFQLWNSIRALDWLGTLPDVDPKRIACTGASGGGTQTFLLAAVDDRVAVSVPVNMVSHAYQGGCLCENLTLLRVGLNNVEISAAIVPRPQLLICCTKDWTKDVPKESAPEIKKVYEMFGAADRLGWVQYDFEHNYNKTSREALYAWLVRWLQGGEAKERLEEPPFTNEPVETVKVHDAEHPLPKDALDEAGLTVALRKRAQIRLASLKPINATTLARFGEVVGEALPHIWAVDLPVVEVISPVKLGWTVVVVQTGSKPDPPASSASGSTTLVALLKPAVGQVVVSDLRGSEEKRDSVLEGVTQEEHRFPATHHRTLPSWRVKDLLDVGDRLDRDSAPEKIVLLGLSDAATETLVAAALDPRVTRVIVDLSELSKEPSQPCFSALGGVSAAAALIAPRPLVLHGVGKEFDASWVRDAYALQHAGVNLRIEKRRLTDEEIVKIVSR